MRLVFVFTFLLFTGISLSAYAQNRQLQKTDSVLSLVKEHIRSKDANSIYLLTGPNFRKAIGPVAFKNVCTQEIFPLGNIKKDSLISFVNNKTATYKIQFDAVTLQFMISLDQNDKVELFLFQPYKDVSVNKLSLAASSNPLKLLQDKKVDTAARAYIQKSNTVGLSIGILKDGKLSTYNYGETAKGSKKLPDAATIYEIGAITKTFTSTLLAWYVNEGKINLTDRITKYLPDSVAGNLQLNNITILNLSNHTSGLPSLPNNFAAQTQYDKLNPYKNYNRQLLFAYLKNCRLNNKPGAKYAYSNLGVGLLGLILEKVSGKPFEQMAGELICTPLGMKSTVQHLYPLMSTRFAKVYDDDGNLTPAWDFNVLAPSGALRSTVNDLALYAKANMAKGADRLAKALELTHQVTFNDDTIIGLGWHVIAVDGVSYYFHNGGTYGSSSFLAFNADKNLAVIILSNASESTDVLGSSLLRKLQ